MAWELSAILYDNRYDNGTPAANATDAGYSVLNIRDWRVYTYWQATGSGPFYLSVDCGSAQSADCMGIISHNLKTSNATISVECSDDNFVSDVSIALSGFVPSADTVIFKKFTAQTKRYWRLKIVLGATSSPQIGILCIGNRLEFPSAPEPPFDPCPQESLSESEWSVNGQLLGSVNTSVRITPKPQWEFLDPTWIKTYFDLFWTEHAAKLKPFFWAWEPGEHADEVFLVSVKPGFILTRPYVTGWYRSLSLDLVGMKE